MKFWYLLLEHIRWWMDRATPRRKFIAAWAALAMVVLVVVLWPSCGFDESKFGGPYEIAYDKIEGKNDDFVLLNRNNLSFSKAEALEKTLFINSIQDNMTRSRYGEEGQLYNYAIDTDGSVFVAVWTVNDLTKIDESECAGGAQTHNPAKEGTMVNWFPEEPRLESSQPKRSPCWLRVESGASKDGVLDAISKHFMLAQGKGTSITDYEKDEWGMAEVAYAGEIVVNVDDCTYSVNDQSGTYQPANQRAIRDALVQYFRDTLKVAPTSVNNRLVNVDFAQRKIDECDPVTS